MEIFLKESIGLLAELAEMDDATQISEHQKKLEILNNILAAINEYSELL